MNTNKEVLTAVEDLFKTGAHFGYSRSRRHPSVKPYIFGVKNRVQIIDLEKTAEQLDAALAFVKKLGAEGRTILFVGNKLEAERPMQVVADMTGMPYVTERWLGGTLTNWSEMKKRVARMRDLKDKREKGELSVYTKKERGTIDKEIAKLERYFAGIDRMERLPHVLFVVDSEHEAISVKEASDLKIPVMSISSVDCDITKVQYPIVANDASRETIDYISHLVAHAYLDGKKSIVSTPLENA